jgi:predicted RNA-binding protein
MCEANVYIAQNGKEDLLMERVDKLIPQGSEIFIENIFGQRKTILARIKELQLVDHRIILERTSV